MTSSDQVAQMKGLDAPFCVGPWMTEELDHHLGVCGLTEGAVLPALIQ